jgi:hypothetical protein
MVRWYCNLDLECPPRTHILKVWHGGGTIGKWWTLYKMQSSEPYLGHWGQTIEGDCGAWLLPSSFLFPGPDVGIFCLAFPPAMMCCLATGSKQEGQLIMH